MMKISDLKLRCKTKSLSGSLQQLGRCEQRNNSSSVEKSSRQLPNYMKPTASSAARKEQKEATFSSRMMSSGTASSAPNPATNSGRMVGYKEVRIPSVNRHPCSSTMKDEKFPKALELRRGATEAEGISVTKVCKYCSFNDHRHDCLPPLKLFVASKRKMMEAQKREKIKGVSPFREPVVSLKASSGMVSLVVDKPVNCEGCSTEEEDDVESAELKEEDMTDEPEKEKTIEFDLDSDSQHSIEEFDRAEDQYQAEKEKLESVTPEDHTKLEFGEPDSTDSKRISDTFVGENGESETGEHERQVLNGQQLGQENIVKMPVIKPPICTKLKRRAEWQKRWMTRMKSISEDPTFYWTSLIQKERRLFSGTRRSTKERTRRIG